jgi:DNA-binding PadR family transcriptional regulator
MKENDMHRGERRTMWETRMRGFGFGFGPPFDRHGRGHGSGHGRGFERGRGTRHGRRGRRPNVRVALLALLTERPMHGYEMIQELDGRTGGAWRPSPGSVYPTLQLLEDEGLITSEETGGRRRFSLTDAGQAEATEAAAEPPWSDFAEDTVASLNDVRESVAAAVGALREVMMNGTDEQRARAAQVLDETRRKLYAILAETE